MQSFTQKMNKASLWKSKFSIKIHFNIGLCDMTKILYPDNDIYHSCILYLLICFSIDQPRYELDKIPQMNRRKVTNAT